MKLFSDSPEKTIAIGRALGNLIDPGSVVCLQGSLGAGKTHFAKGVALGLAVEEHVTSPTFTIINEYEGRIPLYHIDVYRLEDNGEAYELGLEEYLDSPGVILIEWPERVPGLLPDEYLTVEIKFPETDSQSRELRFLPQGEKYKKLINRLRAVLIDELPQIFIGEANTGVRAGD